MRLRFGQKWKLRDGRVVQVLERSYFGIGKWFVREIPTGRTCYISTADLAEPLN